MSDPGKAVFLSYASQDAGAAKRICDALRAAGVEVWFDQNELVGGDAWDAKIRGQISSCALFMPVISANTQARLEGYFRLEWKLAAQRTHTMADEKAFLLPVVIDETKDAVAKVPAELKVVQWTRLPGGETPPAFVARVKKLLSEEQGAGSKEDRERKAGFGDPALQTSRPQRSLRWGLAAAVAIGVAVLAFTLARKSNQSAAVKTAASATDTYVSRPEVARLLTRVRTTTAKFDDILHTELDSMEELLGQAAKLDPADPAVWAEWAMIDCRYINHNFDRSPTRRDAARRHASQAMGLGPGRPDVRLAQADVMLTLAGGETKAEATKLLLPLLTETPGDGRVPLMLGWVAFNFQQPEASLEWFDRAVQVPGYAVAGHFAKARMYYYCARTSQAGAELDRAQIAGTSAEVLLWKAFLLAIWNGDLPGARRALAEVPPQFFVEDMPAATRFYVEWLSRNYDQALTALRAVPHDYLQSDMFRGPTGFLNGCALAQAGKKAAAELEWRSALATVERRLVAEPNGQELMRFKALLLAALGDREAGRKIYQAVQELYGPQYGQAGTMLQLQFLPADEAFAWVAERVAAGDNGGFLAAQLRLDPIFDPIRSNPRFPALLAQAEADPRLSPTGRLAPDRPGAQASNPGPTRLPEVDAKSVAVLAFANLSDDKGNEYFSDGISEELLNVLAKVPGLKVSARTSAFYFKGKDVPIPEIAAKLGVAYVIEGSVRKQGEKVRITAQLIKAADGFHVWSDTFTRDLKDVFAVQDEIAGLIAQQLQLKLGGSSRANKLVNPEAYDLYLRARALSRLEDENYLPIIKLYEAAVAKDPEFALAYVQLSLACASDYWAGGLDSKPAARAALQAAQRLAPDAPETRLAAGSYAYSCENDWTLARTEFLAAEAGLPGDAQVAFFLGMVQRRLLSFDESIRQVARAIELDPADRNNFAQQVHTLKALRRYPELVDLAGAALRRFPADENFLQTQAIARCEIDRDQAAYLRRVRELPAVEARARALKDYSLALNAGEWEAAGRILAGAQLDYLSITPATTRDPIAMQQAMLAHLQGRPELAQRFGAEALAFYQAQHGSLRQDKWMKLGQALALAYAGRGEEAIRLARETLAATALRDPWDTVILHTYAGHVYLVAGHRDDALAELRIMMAGPCLQGAEELRRDPLWRTVKDDPRFEEILRSAKPL